MSCKNMNCLPLARTWVRPVFWWRLCCTSILVFYVVFCFLCLRYESCVQCCLCLCIVLCPMLSVSLYCLFSIASSVFDNVYYVTLRYSNAHRIMSYLRYLCLFSYSGTVSNTYCVVFLFCFSSSCVPYVASFSGLSLFLLPLRYSLTFIYSFYC